MSRKKIKPRKKKIALENFELSQVADSNPHPDAVLKIELEDHGQDFLYWEVNKDGVVVRCWPYQEDIWNGTYVDLKELKLGKRPKIVTRYGVFLTLNYPVIAITEL